ncbi:MAG: hypothetical protein ACPH86_06585 [Schleiferiaceae bacterium]
MDGFAMENPNWRQEIEISRKCVAQVSLNALCGQTPLFPSSTFIDIHVCIAQINAMVGDNRPLFVCVCGDLVDTESSFSGAIASWKKVMSGWERSLVFEQRKWIHVFCLLLMQCLFETCALNQSYLAR